MSWDADLIEVESGYVLGDWNYTHNTSPMIHDALREAGIEMADGESWWRRLDGMTGPQGRDYLGQIIRGLEAHPRRYREMNPPNKWGNYDQLVGVLHEMRARVPYSSRSRWEACG